MTKTEAMLLQVHGAPLVPLADICERYFGIGYKKASEYAALQRLPVPTWRLLNSKRAPLLVRVSDLAEYIDTSGDAERERWQKSQVN